MKTLLCLHTERSVCSLHWGHKQFGFHNKTLSRYGHGWDSLWTWNVKKLSSVCNVECVAWRTAAVLLSDVNFPFTWIMHSDHDARKHDKKVNKSFFIAFFIYMKYLIGRCCTGLTHGRHEHTGPPGGVSYCQSNWNPDFLHWRKVKNTPGERRGQLLASNRDFCSSSRWLMACVIIMRIASWANERESRDQCSPHTW